MLFFWALLFTAANYGRMEVAAEADSSLLTAAEQIASD